MESIAEYGFCPVTMAFVLGVMYLHVGLRSRPSLIAVVSLVLMLAWMSLAHRMVHEYVIPLMRSPSSESASIPRTPSSTRSMEW